MTLTRADVETEVVSRLSGRLAYVGKAVTVAGSNADLNGPIRRAVAFMGYATATRTVADADLAVFTGWAAERLYDVATLQSLYDILGQCTEVDQQVESDMQRLGQFTTAVERQIAMLEDRIAQPYGPGIPAPQSGVISAGSSGLVNDVFGLPATVSPAGRWPYP